MADVNFLDNFKNNYLGQFQPDSGSGSPAPQIHAQPQEQAQPQQPSSMQDYMPQQDQGQMPTPPMPQAQPDLKGVSLDQLISMGLHAYLTGLQYMDPNQMGQEAQSQPLA